MKFNEHKNGGSLRKDELNCLTYFENGACPKSRWNSKYGAMNMPGLNGCQYCIYYGKVVDKNTVQV